MFLQGSLQAVFDALYVVGALDPVLKEDWSSLNEKMCENPEILDEALQTINACAGDHELLVNQLNRFDTETLSFVALEVARELAEFTDRQSLH